MHSPRFLFILLLILPGIVAAVAARAMSDADKRDIVYQMYHEYKQDDFPGIPDISPDSATTLAKRGRVVFVDTRTGAEREVSMLPGAVSADEFREHIDSYRDATVVAYCTISYRSGGFVRDLTARGIDAYNLRGGILAWTLEGGAVVHDGEPTQRLHVYGGKWNYAPDGYEVVEFGWFRRLLHWVF